MNAFDMRAELKKAAPLPSICPPAAFQAEFQARAQGLVREAPGAVRAGLYLRWALASGLALLLVSVGLWHFSAAAAPARNAIRQIQVAVPYNAMFIIDDAQAQGIIVWIDTNTGPS